MPTLRSNGMANGKMYVSAARDQRLDLSASILPDPIHRVCVLARIPNCIFNFDYQKYNA